MKLLELKEMRLVIYMVHKNRFGATDFDEDDDPRDFGHMLMDDMYEKHQKNLKIDDWIMDYHQQLAQAAELKQKGNMNVEEYIKMKQKFKKQQVNGNNLSGDIDNSNKPNEVSVDEGISIKKNSDSSQYHKRLSSISPGKHSVEGIETKLNGGSLTPTKKDIKKKRNLFDEPEKPYAPRHRHEKSYEDFAEFEKIAPMVKQVPHESPELKDMNQVLAEHIKKRYRSTDRFIRVQKYVNLILVLLETSNS